MENERILNPELREYIKQTAIDYLEGCEDFVKVFGKEFAQRKFEENVKDVYSNEKDDERAGYYEAISGDITICAFGKNGSLLTPNDVEQDEDMKETCVHEAIHGILKRIIKSRIKIDGRWRRLERHISGIHEVSKDGVETGIGLNEGLTEWICKKAGLKAESYYNLMRYVEQLENALGSRKVMQLGKGNISKNVTKILKMQQRECNFFLKLLDQEYTLERNENFFSNVINNLEVKRDEEYLRKIKKDSRIQNFIQSQEYEMAIEEKGQDKEAEIILEYIREQGQNNEFARRVNLLTIDSTIFDKYFKKEFEVIESKGRITYKQLQKFSQIAALMQRNTGNQTEENYSSLKFQKSFERLRERYITELCEKAIREYQEGRLSGIRLSEYISETSGINEKTKNELLEKISSRISPEHSNELTWLIKFLEESGEIREDISRYSMRTIKIGEMKRTIFLKDNELTGTIYFPITEEVEKNDDDIGGYLNFTLDTDEEFYSIIEDFLRLKEDVEKVDPEARIQISNRIIMISGKNGQEIYTIGNGRIMPAEGIQEITFEFAQNDKESNQAALAVRRPIDRIREYLFRKRQEAPGKRLETRIGQNEFKKRIRDMSNYALSPAAKGRNELKAEEKETRTFNIKDEEK